jgi:hypothetical protein
VFAALIQGSLKNEMCFVKSREVSLNGDVELKVNNMLNYEQATPHTTVFIEIYFGTLDRFLVKRRPVIQHIGSSKLDHILCHFNPVQV